MTFTACDNAASKISNDKETSSSVDVSSVDGEGSPQFSFAEETHDFGEIEEGTVAKHDFTFKNTGDAPLIITNAQGSCGCTVPEWPREPIAPGEEGTIHVEFNSAGRAGNQQKEVKLQANTNPNTFVLKITAQVKAKEQPAAEGAQG